MTTLVAKAAHGLVLLFFAVVFAMIAAPFVIVGAIFRAFGATMEWVELQAYYDGDEAQRDYDAWRNL